MGGGVITFTWARPLLLLVVVMASLIAATQGRDPLQEIRGQQTPAMSDQKLYRQIAASVRGGEDYYSAAIARQRAAHYPVRPFFTVRMPVLAWVHAAVGDRGLRAMAIAATLGVIVFWLWRLDARSRLARLAGCGVVAAAAVPLALSPFIYFHDYWAGLLLAVALGVRGRAGRAVFGLGAVLVRELTLPFLAIEALLALRGQAPRRPLPPVATWPLVALVIAGVAIAAHAAAVHGITTAGDLASRGWQGLRGPAGAAEDLAGLTALQILPWPVAAVAAFAPLLGWYDADDGRAGFCWFALFVGALCTFARPDNVYWVACILPAYFVGIVYVPGFLIKAWRDGATLLARRTAFRQAAG